MMHSLVGAYRPTESDEKLSTLARKGSSERCKRCAVTRRKTNLGSEAKISGSGPAQEGGWSSLRPLLFRRPCRYAFFRCEGATLPQNKNVRPHIFLWVERNVAPREKRKPKLPGLVLYYPAYIVLVKIGRVYTQNGYMFENETSETSSFSGREGEKTAHQRQHHAAKKKKVRKRKATNALRKVQSCFSSLC